MPGMDWRSRPTGRPPPSSGINQVSGRFTLCRPQGRAASRHARPLAPGAESQMAPRFSPQGNRLAFTQDYAGDENYDIFVHDLATGQTRNVTPDTPAETINPVVAWSPDGKHIAFVSNREGKFAAYVLRADAKQPRRTIRRVTHHEYSDAVVDWSPDGPASGRDRAGAWARDLDHHRPARRRRGANRRRAGWASGCAPARVVT